MRETNVWLSPEELKHMLQGSLQWNDVASRVTTSKMGFRKFGETKRSEKVKGKGWKIN